MNSQLDALIPDDPDANPMEYLYYPESDTWLYSPIPPIPVPNTVALFPRWLLTPIYTIRGFFILDVPRIIRQRMGHRLCAQSKVQIFKSISVENELSEIPWHHSGFLFLQSPHYSLKNDIRYLARLSAFAALLGSSYR